MFRRPRPRIRPLVGPAQTCPECGARRWIQTNLLWREETRTWSGRRTCKACGQSWDACWVDQQDIKPSQDSSTVAESSTSVLGQILD
jgi:hypothetical protein